MKEKSKIEMEEDMANDYNYDNPKRTIYRLGSTVQFPSDGMMPSDDLVKEYERLQLVKQELWNKWHGE